RRTPHRMMKSHAMVMTVRQSKHRRTQLRPFGSPARAAMGSTKSGSGSRLRRDCRARLQSAQFDSRPHYVVRARLRTPARCRKETEAEAVVRRDQRAVPGSKVQAGIQGGNRRPTARTEELRSTPLKKRWGFG